MNLRGRVDWGTIEALEGGIASCVEVAAVVELCGGVGAMTAGWGGTERASLKRLLAGVALTIVDDKEGRAGFLSSAQVSWVTL